MPDYLWWLREWNPILIYARWRESYLSAHPEKRLFSWLAHPFDSQDSEASSERERSPFISFTPEFKEKTGNLKWALVVLALVLLASDRKES